MCKFYQQNAITKGSFPANCVSCSIRSSNQFQTTSNEAYNYNIVRGTGRTAEASEDSLYEPV